MAESRQDLSNIAGPESMAAPTSSPNEPGPSAGPKRKKHRGGRNKRKKTQENFNSLSEAATHEPAAAGGLNDPPRPTQTAPFYRVRSRHGSNTSLESEALLDHREYTPARPRRQSLQQSGFTRPSLPFARHRGSTTSGANAAQQRARLQAASSTAIDEDEAESPLNDRTPLLSTARNRSRPEISRNSSAHLGSNYPARRSSATSKSSSQRRLQYGSYVYPTVEDDEYDVNNPPSVPTSPRLGSLDDLMLNELSSSNQDRGRDAIIDIDEDNRRYSDASPDALRRRPTVADLAARDVCFPAGLSEIGEDEEQHSTIDDSERLERRRTRTRQWPDLSILHDWSREEKEERTQQEHIRAKKINEPVMVGGRLRPVKTTTWHREEDDAPFRFTYFNEAFDGTIHARTISDLTQEGTTFKDLFLPEPIELHDSSDEEEDENALEQQPLHPHSHAQTLNGRMLGGQMSRQPSVQGTDATEVRSITGSKTHTRSNTPSGQNSQGATPRPYQKPKRYGPRPTFWLDVLQPTEMEMKVLAKAFGIHQLTTEDILMEEQREKVELFQSYYFLNYRSFEQDKESEDYMDPVNFYVVVFRDGVITFHLSQTPHPANVRRRIRQLNDYMSPTADWISYAIIDDITDVYGPRVSTIEEEVDEIDEEILYLHVTSADQAEGPDPNAKPQSTKEKSGSSWWPFGSDNDDNDQNDDKPAVQSGGDMLRRVGECRKKVMSLYRLLGNKADVIKGFAKRCNENWEVAPRSEIGLYLGDIQDHIITMNNNLSHYENLLSRAHSNYVAQINIRMNERAEKNADILGKLTVVGTIVLPMNIITGMWGMNVYVPGQTGEGGPETLTWFWCITAGLLAFGFTCFFAARKIYGIV